MDPVSRFEWIVLTPPGLLDPALAAAASRSGALGVLDLEGAAEKGALQAIATLDRLARGPIGVKLDGSRPDFAARIIQALPPSATTVVLTPGAVAALVAAARAAGRRVLFEATSPEEADLGLRLGADGLIAKGHEAAGRIGEETTFILLQRFASYGVPVFAQGGIGLHSAAAACAGGAAGCVLDAQLDLTRESPLPAAAKRALQRLDGSETVVVERDGRRFRVLGQRFSDAMGEAWPLGQDAAFAAPLAEQGTTVAGVLQAMRAAVASHLAIARKARALDRDAPLARSHGTLYPIVQGPMTRVSDTAPFAAAVAGAGALPFLALALLRKADAQRLLEETRARLGARPWGAGILGFVPLALRQEQMEAIRACKPSFALIAGGRPDQARALEADGIPTYLHVPSPGLLKLFLEQGARRFVFEGRECGGHVGPRTSFVLWNTMVDVLLKTLEPGETAACHVLFAAGIHDARSAAMVAALAAPLVERGAKIGVLLGTAYLFTKEAVEAGAIVPGFQEAAVGCSRTVLLETGPGHATRCVDSPFAETFERERRRLVASGAPAEETRNTLEALNLGRLRLASKGVDRDPRHETDPGAPRLREVGAEEQRREGMFMIGQVAALRDGTVSMADLHRDVAEGSAARLEALAAPELEAMPPTPAEKPSDVAIVGMASLLPGAPDLGTYWKNILDRSDAIGEVPADRFDWRLYYDADRGARDRVYSKWGGFLGDTPFDPLRYGITPASLRSIEPVQLLLLDVVRAGLRDAGYLERPFPRKRSSVILGAGGGISDLGSLYTMRSLLPSYLEEIPRTLLKQLPEWTEDSFPGILLNVAAGRVANRFDLGGANFTVDAACASSLAALYLSVRELETGSSDLVITGGIDTAQNPFMFLCFSKTHAHSPRGRCRTFDASADGIAISEGIAVLVLKRLRDAERDGDRVYAVIKAVGASSDGRDRGLTAPRPEGQMLAVERAYAKAGFSPATVSLVEAHGTGTVAGDQAEVTTLKRVFDAHGAARQACAIGSVKSIIGHTKCTAGVAGVQKVALALHHKVLPPTLHVEKPNPKAAFETSPFYVNAELRPWLGPASGEPRRAGVSAFGFGGTNFHAVLEEHRDSLLKAPALHSAWPAELYVLRGRSREEIAAEARRLRAALQDGAEPEAADLAHALWRRAAERADASWRTLAIVAESIEDLSAKLSSAAARLEQGPDGLAETGLQFAAAPYGRDGHVAILFPGQGCQSVDMLRDLALHFEEVRGVMERFDAVLRTRHAEPLSRYVFPPPSFTPEEKRARQDALTATEVAQPALGAAGLGAWRLLESLGLRASMAAGHSYGEYVALAAAEVIDEATLAHLSERRGRAIRDTATEAADLGTMAAAPALAPEVAAAIAGLHDVWIAGQNAPRQTVVSGTREGVARAVAALAARGIAARMLPVACAFHSPVVAGARDRLAAVLAEATFAAPGIKVFSNATAAAYPSEPSEVRDLLASHLTRPVRFTEEIEAMHQAGARLFVEVGPKNVLTSLTQQILADRPHVAVPVDVPGRHGLVQLLHALSVLLAHEVPLDLDRLFAGRVSRSLDLARLAEETRPQPLSPTTWLVNGAYARPLGEPRRSLQRAATEQPPAPERVEVPAVAPIAAAAEPVAAPIPAGANADVVLQFQGLMTQFLETQRRVMEAYLGGSATSAPMLPVPALTIAAPAMTPAPIPSVVQAPPPAAARAEAPAVFGRAQVLEALIGIAADRTGYPAAMIDVQADIEADLGIDSIKRVEILGALQRSLPEALTSKLQAQMETLTRARTLGAMADTLAAGAVVETAVAAPPPVAAQPAPARAPAVDVLKSLVAIVADRTGYPADMIALDADIEADLGIDSIKRVEILGALQRALPAAASQSVQENMERLTRARTLRDIAAATSVTAPAPDAVAPAVPAPAPAPAGVDVVKRLVAIVADRTGYPADMIALDADIEADLGIDSIKRVEILGALQRSLPAIQENMERLTRARTLREMAAAAEGSASKSPVITAAPAPAAETIPNPGKGVPARFLVRAVESAAVAGEPLRLAGARVLITDDGRGVADALADLLRASGALAVVAASHPSAGRGETWTADFADPGGAAALLERFRAAHGALTGLVHLLPFGGRASLDLTDLTTFKRRMALEVSGLFHLARAAAGDLKFVAAVTARGALDFFPGGAGVTGFLKTLALEWTGTRVKAVDAEAEAAPADLATRVLEEIAGGDPEIEVAFSQGRRHVLRPVEAPLVAAPATTLGENAVVLITGGARGITGEAAIELARRHRPTLVLVGRAPEPALEEASETSGITATDALRTALLARLRSGGAVPTPAAVERALLHLHAERDMRRTLAALRAAGARVRYLACDVRDPVAFGDLVDAVYAEHGRIDGVVHGAGLIEDRLIADKDPASFERVFSTKVDAAFVLASRLRLADLKFFVAFTSVAGRFGNRGQSDYAAANETVAAILKNLDRSTPARLAALHWGPWDGTGMASPEVRRQFAARGVGLVAPAEGARACADEIGLGRKGEVDVILGEGPWRRYAVSPEPAHVSPARALPFLGSEPLAAAPGGGIQFDRLLDPSRDRYLGDHRLDGKPVFPAACAMELMAETAQCGWPEHQVLSIDEFRVVKGIVLEDGPKTVRVTARPETQPDPERLEVAIDVAIVDPQSGRPFYRATLRLGERLPEPEPLPYAPLRAPRPFSKTVEGAYADWLFHGPLFQGLLSIDRVGEDGIAGLIRPSDPGRCLADGHGSAWIVDPIVVDSAFQLGILYARSQYDTTPLPARFRRFRRFAPLDRGPIRCEFRSRAVASDSVLEIQIALLDERGRLLGLIEDMELSCSRDLNRLAGRGK